MTEPTNEITTEVTLSVPQETDSGYLTFQVQSIGANVRLTDKTTQRTVWATLSVPESRPIQVVHQRWAGAGPQPENTITMFALSEIVQDLARNLQESITEKSEDSW